MGPPATADSVPVTPGVVPTLAGQLAVERSFRLRRRRAPHARGTAYASCGSLGRRLASAPFSPTGVISTIEPSPQPYFFSESA